MTRWMAALAWTRRRTRRRRPGVSVSLALVGAQNTVSAGLDTLISIENLTGSSFGDTLTGDAGNNVLSGGAGVDTLIGGLGDDTLIGGDNTDFIVDLSGVVSIDGGAGNEQITLGAGVVSGVPSMAAWARTR